MIRPGSTADKIATTVFRLLCGGAWFAYCLVETAPVMFSQLSQWHQARSYVAVAASVRDSGLAYHFRGRDYTGGKPGPSEISELGEMPARPGNRRPVLPAPLRQAQAADEQVIVWVDPQQPSRAMYERNFPWDPFFFMLGLTTLFGGGGLAIIGSIWFVWRAKPTPAPMPALRKPMAPTGLTPLNMTLVAIFGNMLSWWVVSSILPQAYDMQHYWAYLLAIFPLLGLWLAWLAGARWHARWRIGQLRLEVLAPAPGACTLQGCIHFHPPFASRLNARDASHPVMLVLRLRETRGVEGDTDESILWEGCVQTALLARGATQLAINVAIPADLPLPSTLCPVRLDWSLEVQALGSAIEFPLPEAGHEHAPIAAWSQAREAYV